MDGHRSCSRLQHYFNMDLAVEAIGLPNYESLVT